MEREGIHELSAAYALDALDPREEREFEQHLARCPECRESVGAFRGAAAALAHASPAQAPPPALRERILRAARAERGNVVPLRPRWALRAAATAAAVASVAAVALAIWAVTLHNQLDDRAQTIALSGARGSLVVLPSGDATLVVADLAPAPSGKTYEAWVIENDVPRAAGLFRGGGPTTAVALTQPVPEGAIVAVTLERAGGVAEPQSDPVFVTAHAT